MPTLFRSPDRNTKLVGINWTTLLILIVGPLFDLQLTTQYLAWVFDYQPALGEPLFWYIYAPWKIAPWLWAFSGVADPRIEAAVHQALIHLAVGHLIVIFIAAVTLYKPRKSFGALNQAYGSASWAAEDDIRAAGLLSSKGIGVYVGAIDEPRRADRLRYLMHDGPEHVFLCAPPRDYKTTGLVIPTLLTWPGSVIAYDIKRELYTLTAGRRQRLGNLVFKFDPAETACDGARFNPLMEIRIGTPHEVKDAQRIANLLVDADARGLADHWARTAVSLFTGAILHVLYAEPNKTLSGLVSFLSDPLRAEFWDTMHLMLATPHRDYVTTWIHGDRTVHPIVAECAREVLSKESREASSVLSTVMSHLQLYRDPTLGWWTSASDFQIRDLMHNDSPVSLYLVVPPSDKARLAPLMKLIVDQVATILTEQMDAAADRVVRHYRHRLLMMLDEFASFGHLPVFASSLSFFPGYGITAYMIVQDLSQMEQVYGPHLTGTIMGTCKAQIFYTPNNPKTAEYISRTLDKTTIRSGTRTFSGNRLSFFLGHVMVTEQDVSRDLMTPGEVRELPETDLILFYSKTKPIYDRKMIYFKDAQFLAWAQIPSPTESDRLPQPAAAMWRSHIPPATRTVPQVHPNATGGAGRERAPEREVAPLETPEIVADSESPSDPQEDGVNQAQAIVIQASLRTEEEGREQTTRRIYDDMRDYSIEH